MRKSVTMKQGGFKKVVKWWYEDVMTMCIRHGYYTAGNSAEYDEMLHYVQTHKNPTDNDIYRVALDIFDHSNEESSECVTDIMFNMWQEVMKMTMIATNFNHNGRC